MITTQTEIDLILSRRMRRRVIERPVRRGPLGELKRCPMRREGVYTLVPLVPYADHRAKAERQPSRARAVLSLIDRCEATGRKVTITVTDVERQGDKWLIRFRKGEHLELFDRPIYLAKEGDFTMSASKQAVPGDPEYVTPFAGDLARARAKAREGRVSPDRAVVEGAKGMLGALEKSMIDMKARNRLALVLKELGKLEGELSVDGVATLRESVCAARQASAAVEGEPRPRGTKSDVSLQSYAPSSAAA